MLAVITFIISLLRYRSSVINRLQLFCILSFMFSVHNQHLTMTNNTIKALTTFFANQALTNFGQHGLHLEPSWVYTAE
jgi:hypothetical protein